MQAQAQDTFSVRTNLLYWLGTGINIGIEYKPAGNTGVLLNAGRNYLVWDSESMYARTFFLQPEVRRYLGERRRWFVGVEGHAGQFNFKLSENKDGRQGDFCGAGLTGGCRLALNRLLDMDFSLGLGYTGLKYEKYCLDGDVFVSRGQGLKKNVWGVTQAAVSLIWKIK